ncbi:hypothetical protein E2562_036425 [Oryza meyeriana var. granulata]|uniref:BHLH domain-containing protein n=1 Tax=Oryza meyeriana var. granulata TaxID=110450 RepID=A0A6G1BPY4_9ORYZ|nr:hypothetical protein E2562_036425 [Oryza meyeriana var. granulata]
MNAQDPAVAGLFIFTDDGHNGENAAVAGNDGFSDMLRDFDYFTEDDLFELMWQGGASCFEQPASPPAAAAPSEEEMAAWLYPIVSGEVAGGRTEADDGRRGALPEKETMEHRPGGLMTTDAASDDSGERKKQVSSSAAGARTRSHHAAGAHNLTEKRRRFKITERLRTLQRLVPGCDKSNQASTLDQTIQYMKSLQHQLKAMAATSDDGAAAAVRSNAPLHALPDGVAAGGATVLTGARRSSKRGGRPGSEVLLAQG